MSDRYSDGDRWHSFARKMYRSRICTAGYGSLELIGNVELLRRVHQEVDESLVTDYRPIHNGNSGSFAQCGRRAYVSALWSGWHIACGCTFQGKGIVWIDSISGDFCASQSQFLLDCEDCVYRHGRIFFQKFHQHAATSSIVESFAAQNIVGLDAFRCENYRVANLRDLFSFLF